MFEASYAKIDRAKQFIAELESFAETYRASQPWAGTLRLVDGDLKVIIDKRDPGLIPGCIVGDAIHNMRAALDLMATDLAADQRVHFPFAENSDALNEAIKDKKFSRCGADAVDLLKSLKPYRGGNTDPRALHDLDVQDKHKSLIPTQDPTDFKMDAKYDLTNPEAGTVTFTIVRVRFAFPLDSEFGGEPVIETLEKLMELVVGILEAFAALVAARQ